MNIDLTPAEKEALVGIVEQYYVNLRDEIHRTDTYEVKEELRDEESRVSTLLQKLRQAK